MMLLMSWLRNRTSTRASRGRAVHQPAAPTKIQGHPELFGQLSPRLEQRPSAALRQVLPRYLNRPSSPRGDREPSESP
jgi:hypothetical protein